MARCALFCLVFLLLSSLSVAAGGHDSGEDWDNQCNRAHKCKKGHGPAVRFPFRLRGHHPPNCGHPDPSFQLSCDENGHTVLNLPRSAKLFVKEIDFILQEIEIYNPYDNGCLQRLIINNPHLNISASPFRYSDSQLLRHYVVFNCSTQVNDEQQVYHPHLHDYIPCLSIPGYDVQAVLAEYYSPLELIGCSSIGVTPVIPYNLIEHPSFPTSVSLNWMVPNCVTCERQRKGCKFYDKSIKNLTARTETKCFPLKPTGAKRQLLLIGAILGSFFLLLAAIILYHVHKSYAVRKKSEMKIKQFLDDYTSLKATRYSYSDIKIVTNQFNQELGRGAFGIVYKGKLSSDILVAVKILTSDSLRNGEEFINEVASMGRIHHVNVARLVGFCADGGRRALVYEFLPNKSLEKFIFPEGEDGKRVVLGLEKLQDIALGIAKGMEYLHHGCDQQILHFDIKPHNILLDHNFVPKISDFGLAKLCSKDKSVVTMTAARGTMGYIAPEVASKNFGKPSHKSDVYSYGMLLLEMVGGKKNRDTNVDNSSQEFLPEWVYKRIVQGEELRIDIEEEGEANIAKKLAIVALKCIQWHPTDRPSMKVVVQMLEGEGDNLIVPPNHFASTCQSVGIIGNRPTRRQNLELEIISEAE